MASISDRPSLTIWMEETTMKTIAFTFEALMRLAVFAAILGAMYHRARMDKRAARAIARTESHQA